MVFPTAPSSAAPSASLPKQASVPALPSRRAQSKTVSLLTVHVHAFSVYRAETMRVVFGQAVLPSPAHAHHQSCFQDESCYEVRSVSMVDQRLRQ